MGKDTLSTLAKVIRSKNAGPFELTFDIMFDDVAKYEHVKRSGLISAARIAEAYRIRVDDVLVCRPYDAAVAFKITIKRPVGSGDIEDRDVYGCQQHVPLTRLEIPGPYSFRPSSLVSAVKNGT
jgi:hypothetical protein